MTTHDGHPALAVHLSKIDDNERVIVRTHGLSADTIADAISELKLMSLGCRTGKPLIHAWASPSQHYSEVDWENHRLAFEVEFDLLGHPSVEVYHLKYGAGGRTATHVHRIYLRIDAAGRAVPVSFSAIRQEKVSRIAEYMAGERFTSGLFNKQIIERLWGEGRPEIAEAMILAGLADARTTTAPASAERAMSERLQDFAADEVWRRAADAWRRSDSGAAFKTALAEAGLRLALGAKCPVVVSPGGAVHPLLRAINKGGERHPGQVIRKPDLDTRLKDLTLVAVKELAPMRGFEAGVFAITNLDRIPVQLMPKLPPDVDDSDIAPDQAHEVPSLTREQEAALLELDDALHHLAAGRAHAMRQAIETQVLEEVTKSQRDRLRLHIEAEKDSWELPSIGVAGWRDRYRAELAGLPSKLGPRLKWVERQECARRDITLRSGAKVVLTPVRAWTASPDGADVIAVMIAHAQEQGWSKITVNGAASWREQMARAAVRAGFVVTDPDLAETIVIERDRMEQEALIDSWWVCRHHLAKASPAVRQSALKDLMNVLDRIAKRAPDIIEHINSDAQRDALAADLANYDRYRQAKAAELAIAAPEFRPKTRPG